MFGDRRMFAIAADAQMRGDSLAFEEDLDRPGGHPDVHLGAGEAIGNAVIGSASLSVLNRRVEREHSGSQQLGA